MYVPICMQVYVEWLCAYVQQIWVLVKHFQMLAAEIRMWLSKPEITQRSELKKKKERKKIPSGREGIILWAERKDVTPNNSIFCKSFVPLN